MCGEDGAGVPRGVGRIWLLKLGSSFSLGKPSTESKPAKHGPQVLRSMHR